jgi:hypothetical protein
MGDHTTETMQLQNRRDERYTREQVLGDNCYLHVDEDFISWILNHVDCFVSQCRGNESVKKWIGVHMRHSTAMTMRSGTK